MQSLLQPVPTSNIQHHLLNWQNGISNSFKTVETFHKRMLPIWLYLKCISTGRMNRHCEPTPSVATTTKKNKPEKKEKHLHTQKTHWKSVKISIHLWYWHRGKIHPELPTTQNNLNIKYEWKCERFNRAKINSTLWKTTRVFICVTVNDLMHQGKEIYVFVFHFISFGCCFVRFGSVRFGSIPFYSSVLNAGPFSILD